MMSEAAKKAQKEYLKAWRSKNKDKVREYNKKYRENNPEKIKAGQQRYWEQKAMNDLQVHNVG